MKKYRLLLILLQLISVSILFTSCEQILEDQRLPHEERLVVYSVLTPNEKIKVFVSKTLPPLTNNFVYSTLNDANVAIEVDGSKYKLLLIIDSLEGNEEYYTTSNFQVESGKVYTLTVERNGKKVQGTTFIPQIPTIQSFWNTDSIKSTLIGNEVFYTVNISSKNLPNTYLFGYVHFNEDTIPLTANSIDFSEESYDVNTVTIDDSTIVSMTVNVSPSVKKTEYARLVSMDVAYKYYISSTDRRSGGSGIFGSGGGNPIWNVSGDGFGLFIGVNQSFAIKIKD